MPTVDEWSRHKFDSEQSLDVITNTLNIAPPNRCLQSRFVIVPIVPIEQETLKNGARFLASAESGDLDIYDNWEKMRFKPSYPTKALADAACAKMNSECCNSDELFLPENNNPVERFE
ncbi:hypothetical protein [Pseudomonas sp. NY15354]|uniref:hypothetical protein n=1 Tax=Pseudomonas sp. NY15354 TaxID=3400351 RepID=UPI003A877200